MDLLLHSVTQAQVEAFIKKPAHGLLISGAYGSGKHALAKHIAANLLEIDSSKLDQHPYYLDIVSESNSISIDTIRELKVFTQLKTTGKNTIRRVIVIDGSQDLTHEAQNAFLKLLEEPPADTVFILTTVSAHTLLPTISSRLQQLVVKQPSKDSIISYFLNRGHQQDSVTKAYHMSQGQISLMNALLEMSDEHPFAKAIEEAKGILRKKVSERLTMINELADSDLKLLFLALYSVAHAALIAAIEKSNKSQTNHWLSACQHLTTAEQQLEYQPSAKLLLSDLFLHL